MARFRLAAFERIVRAVHLISDEDASAVPNSHPFEQRNLSERLPKVARDLFDNGHYAQATFEALKFLDREVARISKISESGKSLMMKAFSDATPPIKLTALVTETEKVEQEGYRFIFAGSIMAIRNPRGHEYGVIDSMDDCLDHLSFVSMLLRRVESAGYPIKS